MQKRKPGQPRKGWKARWTTKTFVQNWKLLTTSPTCSFSYERGSMTAQERVDRLRAYADAVIGKSDLKVGPCSIREILMDTADYLDKIRKVRSARRKRSTPAEALSKSKSG